MGTQQRGGINAHSFPSIANYTPVQVLTKKPKLKLPWKELCYWVLTQANRPLTGWEIAKEISKAYRLMLRNIGGFCRSSCYRLYMDGKIQRLKGANDQWHYYLSAYSPPIEPEQVNEPE